MHMLDVYMEVGSSAMQEQLSRGLGAGVLIRECRLLIVPTCGPDSFIHCIQCPLAVVPPHYPDNRGWPRKILASVLVHLF